MDKLHNLKIEYTGKDEVYTGGLRFNDAVSLKWEHYNEKEQRITKTFAKQEEPTISKSGRLQSEF